MDKYIGKRLDGRYEIKELIGVGGMAYVYKAYDSIDDRVVAIKILREELLANEEFTRRFKNESKAIAILSHPNIVKVYDVSFGERLQYIVMEYIDGITLKEYIESRRISSGRKPFISRCRSSGRCSMPTTRASYTGISSRRTSCCCRTAPSR